MPNVTYERRWASKEDASVETTKYYEYDRKNDDGSTTKVKESSRPTYYAKDGKAYTAAGESETRIVYVVPVIEETLKEE